MSTNLKILLKGSLISLVGTGVLGVLNYFVRRELALNLTLVDFGFIYSVLSLINIFLAYLDIGISGSATILISKSMINGSRELVNRYFSQIFFIKLFASLIIFFVLLFTYGFWVYDFFKFSDPLPYFILISMLLIQPIATAPNAVITALKRYAILSSGKIISPLIILVIIFFYNKPEINLVAFLFPLGALAMLVFLFIVSSSFNYFPFVNSFKKIFRCGELFHLSKWIAVSTLGLTTMYYMDSLMLTWLDGLKSVGLYNVALPIMQIAQSLMVLPGVFLPIVSGMWANREENEIGKICSMITEITLYILFPVAISIVLLSKYLIIFLFSAKFTAAAPALMILFAGNILFSLANFYMGTLNSGKYAKKVAITVVLGVILNLSLNYILIPYISITGAALATACSYLFLTVYLFLSLKASIKTFSIKFNSLILFSCVGGVILAITLYVNFNYSFSLKNSILYFVLFNIIYFVVTIKVLKRYIKFAMSTLKK